MDTQPTIESLQEELTITKIRLNESPTHTPAITIRELNRKKKINVKLLIAYCADSNILLHRVYSPYGKGNFNYPNYIWRIIYPKIVLPEHSVI